MTDERLIVRRRIGDTETPVGALLKLGPNDPGSFLFESIHGESGSGGTLLSGSRRSDGFAFWMVLRRFPIRRTSKSQQFCLTTQ